jgi:hypothetical protein
MYFLIHHIFLLTNTHPFDSFILSAKITFIMALPEGRKGHTPPEETIHRGSMDRRVIPLNPDTQDDLKSLATTKPRSRSGVGNIDNFVSRSRMRAGQASTERSSLLRQAKALKRDHPNMSLTALSRKLGVSTRVAEQLLND